MAIGRTIGRLIAIEISNRNKISSKNKKDNKNRNRNRKGKRYECS